MPLFFKSAKKLSLRHANVKDILSGLNAPKQVLYWLQEISSLTIQGKWPLDDKNRLKDLSAIVTKLREFCAENNSSLSSGERLTLNRLINHITFTISRSGTILAASKTYQDLQEQIGRKTTKISPMRNRLAVTSKVEEAKHIIRLSLNTISNELGLFRDNLDQSTDTVNRNLSATLRRV